MKTLASLMILSFCLVFPLAAQTDKNVEDEIPRSVNEATMIGIGGYNVMDTYLTPGIETKYTGWGVRIQNERMKIVRLAEWDTTVSKKFAKQAIRHLQTSPNYNLPKDGVMIFEI